MKNPTYNPKWSERFASATTDEERTEAYNSQYEYTEQYRDSLMYDIMTGAKEYELNFDLPEIGSDATIDEIWDTLKPFWNRMIAAEKEHKMIPPQIRRQMNFPAVGKHSGAGE